MTSTKETNEPITQHCTDCDYEFPTGKLIPQKAGLICLDCLITDLAPAGPDDPSPRTTNLHLLHDYIHKLQGHCDPRLTVETAQARWRAAIHNVELDTDPWAAWGITDKMRDALKAFDATLDPAKLTEFPDSGQASPIRPYQILWEKCAADLGTKGWHDVMAALCVSAVDEEVAGQLAEQADEAASKRIPIRPGFYGWIPYEDDRRAVFVKRVLGADRLIVEIAGIPAGEYDIPIAAVTPDPDALFWTGHVPTSEEHQAELAKLRIFMAGGDRDPEGEVE